MTENQLFGFKEIYNCVIKAINPMTIMGKQIEANEPIITLDSIQVANVNEIKNRVNAQGGYNNQTWVTWESTKEVNFSFTQGVFSTISLALLGNSNIYEQQSVILPQEELELEVNEEKKVKLKNNPISGTLFIYDLEGNKITDYTLSDNIITFNDLEPYANVNVYYNFNYTNGAQILTIGKQFINGYVSLSFKTRLKDDITGNINTAIFMVPKARLMSNFAIQLGNDLPPTVGYINFTYYPTGNKGSEQVFQTFILNEDIE